jgi:hypothetical protein
MPELKRDEIKEIKCIPSDLSKRDQKNYCLAVCFGVGILYMRNL